MTTLGKPGFPVAELARLPQGYFISAVHGAKPPQVNGRAIGTAPQALRDHDIIEFPGGNVEFLLRSATLAPVVEKSSSKFVYVVLVIVVLGFLVWWQRH